LALFLFLIVVEGLTGLVREARHKNLLYGIKVGRKGVNVDLLQFADDTLLFCQPTYGNVLTFKAILRSFELVSRLKVNFHKSQVRGIRVSQVELQAFSNCLNYRQMKLPFKYLGMIVGGNPRRASFWDHVIDKVQSRLSRWKGRLLSMAGRVCLIKFVITALPLFYLSFFKASITMCNKIRKLQAKFLWGWGHEGKQISWVSWEKVCRPLQEGGLRIKDVGNFNVALLSKWKWRLGGPELELWREVLKSRYGFWREWILI